MFIDIKVVFLRLNKQVTLTFQIISGRGKNLLFLLLANSNHAEPYQDLCVQLPALCMPFRIEFQCNGLVNGIRNNKNVEPHMAFHL